MPEAKVVDLRLCMAMVCNSLEARIHFAKQGAGIAWGPNFSVSAELNEGSLMSVLEDFIAHTDTFSMVWPSGRQEMSRLRAFIAFMSHRLNGQQQNTRGRQGAKSGKRKPALT